MVGKRVARRSQTGRGFLVILGVAALLTALIGWSISRILSEVEDDGSVLAGAPSSDGVEPSASPDGQPDADPLKGCAAAVERATDVVAAARVGVGHWQSHVQARTNMLADRISEKQMNAVYEATTKHAPADHDRFRKAMADFKGGLPCENLRSADGGEAASDCLARSEAATKAVSAARNAMTDWISHAHHMAAYEDGGMSTGKALRLWVKAWRSAPRDIKAFDQASRELAKAPPCSRGA